MVQYNLTEVSLTLLGWFRGENREDVFNSHLERFVSITFLLSGIHLELFQYNLTEVRLLF